MIDPFEDLLINTKQPDENKVVKLYGSGTGVGTERINLELDMAKQTRKDVTYLIQSITRVEVRQQERIDNPATRMTVDGSPVKPLEKVQRRTVTTFGNELDYNMILAIEKSLKRSIKRFLPTRVSARTRDWLGYWGRNGLDDIRQKWGWYYKPPGAGGYRRVTHRELKDMNIEIGSRLMLRPHSSAGAVGYLNHIAKSIGRGITARRGPNKGQTRVDNSKGFMGHSIYALKRSRWSQNYTMYVTFTKAFQTAGDHEISNTQKNSKVPETRGFNWKHGTPYIVVVARQRINQRGTRRTYRKY